MAKYLVKFVNKKHMPDFDNLGDYSIRLGSFLDYKKTEDLKRQDRSEGQRGLHLTIKRPCEKLAEFIKEEKILAPEYTSNELDEEGNFIPEVNILSHEHLDNFNAWIFCCSIIDDLNDIEDICNKFNADSYYFISDINKFINEFQSSLGKNLQQCPNNKKVMPRVKYHKSKKVYLDGFYSPVNYSNDSKYMNFTYNTLEDFLASEDNRTIDKKLWFRKAKKFEDEKEFRFMLYPTSGRAEDAYYNVDEESCFLNINLNGCISVTPIDISNQNRG
jgi:hypothetical protein